MQVTGETALASAVPRAIAQFAVPLGVFLLALRFAPVAAQAKSAIHTDVAEVPGSKQPTQREGTKQAMLIAMLQAPAGATIQDIIAATG